MIHPYFSEVSCFTIFLVGTHGHTKLPIILPWSMGILRGQPRGLWRGPDISVCRFNASQVTLSSVKGFLRFENTIVKHWPAGRSGRWFSFCMGGLCKFPCNICQVSCKNVWAPKQNLLGFFGLKKRTDTNHHLHPRSLTANAPAKMVVGSGFW